MTVKSRFLGVLLATTCLTAPAMAADYTPTLGNDSAYTTTKVTSGDAYNFTNQIADSEGNLTTEYYRINFKADKMGGQNTTVSETAGNSGNSIKGPIKVNMPNENSQRTLYYEYTTPGNYTETNSSVTNITAEGAVENKLFRNVNNVVINNGSLDNYNLAIKSDFINNKKRAIENKGAIGNVTGDFISNYFEGDSNFYGGAIYNRANSGKAVSVSNITGNFIGNHVSPFPSAYVFGGAIANYTDSGSVTIGNITGNYIGNYISGRYSQGGAIYNRSANIGNITGNFIGNYAFVDTSAYSFAIGGAIMNQGVVSMGDITGDFIGNYTSGATNTFGGAIYNSGNITFQNMTGDFVGNYVNNTKTSTRPSTDTGYEHARGGAIYNNADGSAIIMGDISGNFVANHANNTSPNSSDTAQGGAIYNYTRSGSVTIENITGDFISNYVISTGKCANVEGGAIFNQIKTSGTVTINNITGDFIGNYATGPSYVRGGGIYNENGAVIKSINGKFIGNHVISSSSTVSSGGGAIYNGNIVDINSDFIGNYVNGRNGSGGAMFGVTADSINGNFIKNYVSGISPTGGAISISTIGNITGNFVGNYVDDATSNISSSAAGGAIFGSSIAAINGDFIGNYARSPKSGAVGGAIYNNNYSSDVAIGDIMGNFTGNYAINTGTGTSNSHVARGGAIGNVGSSSTVTIDSITGDFTGNYVSAVYAYGGAIYNSTDSGVSNIGEIRGNFIGNYAVSSSSGAYGGAIYNGNNLNASITLAGNNFANNYIKRQSGIIPNDIYNAGTINIASGATVTINDGWDSTNEAVLSMESGSTLNMNIGNDSIQDDKLGNLTKNGSINATIDINLYTRKADTISTSSVTLSDSNPYVTVTAVNIMDSLPEEVDSDYKIQILKTQTGGLQLDIPAELSETEYVIGIFGSSSITEDEILTTTKWTDEYQRHITAEGMIYGKLSLATTTTANDSIGITETRRVDEATEDVSMGDTLVLVAGADIGDREFNAEGAESVYTLSANIGTVAQNKLDINGVLDGDNRPTLNMNDKLGFVLDKATELSFNNLSVQNSNGYLVNVTNADAVVNMTNVNNTSGAINSRGTINVTADGAESTFTDSPITISGGKMNFNALNGGVLTFNDAITATGADINVYGDDSGEVMFNNTVTTNGNFGLGEDAVVHLGANSKVIVKSMNILTDNNMNTHAAGTRTIKLDVAVDRANNKVNTPTITVSGELSGNYNVVVKSQNTDTLDNRDDAITPFLYAKNDTDESDESFNVVVEGSPYEWTAGRNVKGETAGSTWYLDLPEEDPDTPDIKHLTVRPEVLSSIGLQSVSMQQTSGMVRNIRNKIGGNWTHNPEALNNVWVLTEGENSETKAPANVDAKIWSVDAGFDMQNDENNAIGLFTSYRKGDYDVKAEGGKYRSTSDSEVDVDSWLAGMYYRYDRDNNWLFATVYGGKQDVESKTDDGAAKYNTDGLEIGASVEGGHYFAIGPKLGVEPSFGIYYTHISLDDTKDNVGKSYEWKDLRHVEVEAGAKLSKKFTSTEVYVKPSLVQTFTSGDEVKVTGLESISTYKDALLTRVEVGTRFGITDKLSGYAWGNYTTGSDYEATSGGLGISYAW